MAIVQICSGVLNGTFGFLICKLSLHYRSSYDARNQLVRTRTVRVHVYGVGMDEKVAYKRELLSTMAEVFQTGHTYGLDMLTTAGIYVIIYSMCWYCIWSPGFVIQGHTGMPAFW